MIIRKDFVIDFNTNIKIHTEFSSSLRFKVKNGYKFVKKDLLNRI